MKQSLMYIAPIVPQAPVTRNVEILDQASDLYDAGKYVESVRRFLDGLDPNLRSKYGNVLETSFRIPHRNSFIKVDIVNDELHVVSDFLRLPTESGRRVAMLRAMGDLNLRRLMLARFVKSGDEVRVEYHCPIALVNTHKLYALFSNFCYALHVYYTEFVTRFGAEPLVTPEIKPYPREVVQRVYDAIQQTGRAAIEATQEFTKERQHGLAWLLISIAFFQIDYYADVQGRLSLEISNALEELDDKLPTSEQVVRAIRVMERVLAYTPEELADCLYESNVLLSTRSYALLQGVQEDFKSGYTEATQTIQAGNYERTVVILLHIIYRAFGHLRIFPAIERILMQALKDSGSKPVEEAAKVLYKAVDRIMKAEREEDLPSTEPEEGLLGRLARFVKELFA